MYCLSDSGLNVERAMSSRSCKQAQQFDTSLGTIVAVALEALDGEQFDTSLGTMVAVALKALDGEQFDMSLGTMVAVALKAPYGEQFKTGQPTPAQIEACRHSLAELHTLAINILIRIVPHCVTILTLSGGSSSQHVTLVRRAPSP